MSRLIVNAIIEDSIASPGNDKDAYMIVSVQDSNGLPVENLTMSSFVVGSEVVGAGGSISHINMVRNGKLPGIYVLFLGPSAETTCPCFKRHLPRHCTLFMLDGLIPHQFLNRISSPAFVGAFLLPILRLQLPLLEIMT